MFYIGKTQTLFVNRFSDYGAYLSDEKNGENEVLLPNKYVDKDLNVDDDVTVFIYRDGEQRIVATTVVPLIQKEEIATLEVVGSIQGGYFLNMGLEKDLFLPNNEAKGQLKTKQKVLVKLRLDLKDQLFATMKIYNHLETASGQYHVNDHVKGIIYELKPPMGAFVAIDDCFHGFVPNHELYPDMKVGKRLSFRVTKIREDGRLNLSAKEKSSVQIFSDIDIILNALKEGDGILYLNDDSDPEHIRKRLNMSKRAFKRSVGHLLKEGKIEILEDGIKLC